MYLAALKDYFLPTHLTHYIWNSHLFSSIWNDQTPREITVFSWQDSCISPSWMSISREVLVEPTGAPQRCWRYQSMNPALRVLRGAGGVPKVQSDIRNDACDRVRWKTTGAKCTSNSTVFTSESCAAVQTCCDDVCKQTLAAPGFSCSSGVGVTTSVLLLRSWQFTPETISYRVVQK